MKATWVLVKQMSAIADKTQSLWQVASEMAPQMSYLLSHTEWG